MKNIIFYVLLLICFFYNCFVIHSQSNCDQDSVKYLIAYNYIINDSVNKENKMTVCDSIVDLDRFWFSRNLTDFPQEKKILDQYRENKKFIWFEPFYSPCLASIFCKKGMSKHVLFFSQIEDNMLRADLLPSKKQFNCTDIYNYHKMASFTEGRIYMFIFNDDGTIKAFFNNEIIYD